ncbi:hypothetical protein SUGI_1125350 [Cryptomeria japonica]|nr:hypothetical protein SUGI_1125350 [Cryptomeria japonica]
MPSCSNGEDGDGDKDVDEEALGDVVDDEGLLLELHREARLLGIHLGFFEAPRCLSCAFSSPERCKSAVLGKVTPSIDAQIPILGHLLHDSLLNIPDG